MASGAKRMLVCLMLERCSPPTDIAAILQSQRWMQMSKDAKGKTDEYGYIKFFKDKKSWENPSLH